MDNQASSNIISLSLRNRTNDAIENSEESPVIVHPQKAQENLNASRRFSFSQSPQVGLVLCSSLIWLLQAPTVIRSQNMRAVTQNRTQSSSQSQRIYLHHQTPPSTPVQERLCEENPVDLLVQDDAPGHTPPKRKRLDENSNLRLVLKQLGLLDILDSPNPPVLEVEMPQPKGRIIIEQTQFAS